jgi:hypothetical protein
MGLYKGKVQSIFIGPYILPSAGEKEKKRSMEKVRTKKIEKKKKKRELIYQEAQSTSSWTRGLKS